jgi:hypothetical protein
MRGQALFAASAFAMMVFAQPASAQQYRTYHDEHVSTQQCQQSRSNRTAGGAVIGGILGAVLGHNVAGGHGSRDEGTALGAVVGAVAGGAIGRNSAQCSRQVQGSYDPYYGQSQYPDQGYYGNEDYRDDRYRDDRYRDTQYRGDDDYYRGECRPGEVITEDRWGREVREQVTLCRGSDGRWRPE